MASKKAKVPLDVLPLLLQLYKACRDEGYPVVRMPGCKCGICKTMRRLERVMPPSREGTGV